MSIRGLHVVSDRRLTAGIGIVPALSEASRGGAAAIHLREPDLPAGELLRLARELRHALQPGTLLIVNDRVDVAVLAKADAVQLGESGLPVRDARRLLPPGVLIGRSVHSLDGAMQAERDGADYLLVGTVFASRSHPGGETVGVELIRDVRARAGIPIIAIGGIDGTNARGVLEAGAVGVAVIASVLGAPDIYEAARGLSRLASASPAGMRD